MELAFFEMFPNLSLSKEDAELFEETRVTRMVSSSRRDKLHVYLESDYPVPKRSVHAAENQIAAQFFEGQHVAVRIIERFHLSGMYNIENLMNSCGESFVQEASEFNPVWTDLLRHAQFEADVEANVLTIVLEDRCLCHDLSEDILDFFDHVINIRCQMGSDIRVRYKEREPRKSMERSRGRMLEEINRITNLSNAAASESAAATDTKDEFLEPGKAVGTGDSSKKDEPGMNAGKGESAASIAAGVSEKIAAAKQNAAGKSSGGASGFSRDFRPAYKKSKQSDNPDVVYGVDFENNPMAISDIDGDIGEVTIHGQIINYEVRETRNGRKIVMFAVTDYTDTITVKLFPREDQQERLFAYVKAGVFVSVFGTTGIDKFDGVLSINFVNGIKKCNDFRVKRVDNEPEKRVELHCHTKMSDMDGVSDVTDIIDRAISWGHSALAVTDHGVVQAFTDAFHKMQKLDTDFKVIYGMEGYLVDDESIVENPRDYTTDETFVVFDIETTGFSSVKDQIIEIGAVKVKGGEIIDRFSTFVNPGVPIPHRIEKLTGINDSMVEDAPFINDALLQFRQFSEDAVYVAHNATFDMGFLMEKESVSGIVRDYSYVDTLGMSRLLVPEISKFTLDSVAKALKVSLENHHRAVDDAEATAHIFLKLLERLEEKDVHDLKGINELAESSDEKVRKSPSHHVILLAANETGRINLYRLVSMSHLRFFNRQAKIPKHLLEEHREGLIIGSACEQGEVYQAILNEKSESEIARLVKFYDYLEIQPNGNNAFMIREDRYENINSEEDLNNINRKIIKLGEQFNKPVVATCDVHFLDPEDEVYRRVLMAGKGFKDADLQAPLYLRTTEEMLKEFEYLGYDKAYEVVVTNTRKIADMIEVIEPVRPDKCPPVIENSDKTLRDICYRRAHEIYGEDLPHQVSDRLEKELNSIIKNGFAVMYIIAQKLVWKSNEDGYLVGSRGSVGSSFVATMSGITEVNPLSPHYYCSSCHYIDFESDEVRAYAGRAGCDMPDKKCPVCGQDLKKDGFDIPFETFLGFKGDKEPDIDLNFSGEYQSKAHKYTEVIFGAGQTFRAGTIGTIADKTAYGYVKKYYEERGISKRSCEIERISVGCTGVRRTTGQHPGGIIVLPRGEEIDSFTPVQHPANDMTTDTITTHFDYHSIDHNLLKLDILGHDDPTMIRMLQDITGTDPKEVKLDDPEVMSLFSSTKALGITPEQIGGCPLGSLGIPEFGTDFVIQMLQDTKPQAFSDLVRISGLSHGTDVWLGNAQTLIEEGKATISTAICTRDDIMTYLINKGMDPSLSFTTMESVRKGKGLKPEMEEAMKAVDVPDWYIWSCKKIKYMFPKAHAAAYVMMAWRIAYYKINYPLAYYAAFFSIRASSFSYEMMCCGQDVLKDYIKEYREKADDPNVKMTAKDDGTLRDLKIAEEMYARGFEFMPIDIFKAKAHQCQVIDGKIMPRLDCIQDLGDKAADGVADAVKDGPFLSKDDFRERTKVSQKVVDHMSELGLLGNLPESNQLSLFDF